MNVTPDRDRWWMRGFSRSSPTGCVRTFAVLVSMALAACTASPEQRAPRATKECGAPGNLFSGQGIGEFKVGAIVDSIRAKCDVVRDTTLAMGGEGQPERRLAVRIGQDTIEATVVQDRIWRIELRSPRFRTSDSLGVGSTLGELRKQPVNFLGYGEGGPFVALPRHCGLSFSVDDRGVLAKELSKLPDDAPVDLILILGC